MKLITLLNVSMLSFMGFALPLTGYSQAYNFSVPANPLWVDTGLSLSAGQTVNFTASGTWNFGLGAVSAAGTAYYENWDRFLVGANQGELLAYIGSDPYQGHWGNGSFFPQAGGYWGVGTGGQFTSAGTGELWLGINDDAVSKTVGDNTGSIAVQVVVVPEPGTCGLLGLGVGGLICSFRRRKA